MEILSTGTPIIVLPNQTSILQLTLGFYKVMQENDLDDEKLLTKYCIAETMDEYIDKAIPPGPGWARLLAPWPQQGL